MVIPGQLTFVFLIWRLASDHTRLSIYFIILYIFAAIIQVKLEYFKKEINFFYFIEIGCYSSLYCPMDGWVCMAT